MTVFVLGLSKEWFCQIDAIVRRCGHLTKVFEDSQHLVEVMGNSKTDADVVVTQIIERMPSAPVIRHRLRMAGWTGPVVAIRNPTEKTERRLEKLLSQLGGNVAH